MANYFKTCYMFSKKYWKYFFVGIFFIFVIAILFFTKSFSPLKSINHPTPTKAKTFNVDVFSNEQSVEKPFVMEAIQQPIFNDTICNIADYGAISDGKTNNSKFIIDAIDDCNKRGGGKVLIPQGKWFTGAISLKSNIDLHLDEGAELLFSANPNDYLPVVFSRYEGIENYNYSPLIYANNCQNIAVTGKGKLIGNGEKWWGLNNVDITKKLYAMGNNNVPVIERQFGSKEKMLRPAFVEFINCNAILLEDFSIENGPFWTIHPTYSKNIIIRNIDIFTEGKNNDGIDIDSSQNVLIENSHFNTHDDAIVLKSGQGYDGLRVNIPTKNIILRNNSIKNGHGAIAIGSEMAGGIENIFAYNNRALFSQYGIRIKAVQSEKVMAKNIWIRDMNIDNASFYAIEISMFYGSSNPAPNENSIPIFNNIHISNIKSTNSRKAVSLMGMPQSNIENITLDDISFLTSKSGLEFSNIRNSSLNNITLQITREPFLRFENAQEMTSSNIKSLRPCSHCVNISGSETHNLDLHQNFFSNFPNKITIEKDVDSQEVKLY